MKAKQIQMTKRAGKAENCKRASGTTAVIIFTLIRPKNPAYIHINVHHISQNLIHMLNRDNAICHLAYPRATSSTDIASEYFYLIVTNA